MKIKHTLTSHPVDELNTLRGQIYAVFKFRVSYNVILNIRGAAVTNLKLVHNKSKCAVF